MTPPVTTMLAHEVASRRARALRAGQAVEAVRRRRRTDRGVARPARLWAGRMLLVGGGAMVRTGLRLRGDHTPTVAAHG
jgi:hypothetical protein